MNSTDLSLIKTAHKKTSFTQEEIDDFRASADPVTGPDFFLSNFFYIQHPVQGRIKYQPFDYQRRLTNVYHN